MSLGARFKTISPCYCWHLLIASKLA